MQTVCLVFDAFWTFLSGLGATNRYSVERFLASVDLPRGEYVVNIFSIFENILENIDGLRRI